MTKAYGQCIIRQLNQIKPELIQAQVDKKCAEYEEARTIALEAATKVLEMYQVTPQYFSKKPEFEYISPMYDDWIKREREYYSKVQVVKLAKAKYILSYDETNRTEGTGAFSTVKEAQAWFLNGGR